MGRREVLSGMELRPYQEEARTAILEEWESGNRRTLLVIPTGTGKTIVFAKIAEDQVRKGGRVLVLAHRGELLEQAADKIEMATGLRSSVEKAGETCLGKPYRVTVGSVQSMMQDRRLGRFRPEHFSTVIVDEAHHVLADSYQKVLAYFGGANVLGVTATPDRGDMKNLGRYFDSLAYEYPLPRAIKEGYLCPIKAQTIPLKIDMKGVRVQSGDFVASDIGSSLEPYLEAIADEMAGICMGRRTVVFLPLIDTSRKFRDILGARGFRAAEVNGGSQDRAEVLGAFSRGEYDVLCNSMLLTEGWDCPPVDCIVCLRPTKSRSLYAQIVGRGTRPCPETGKDHLLLLDFLWLTEAHSLCHPASLVCEDEETAARMTKNLEEANGPVGLEEAMAQAGRDVIEERERALAEKLAEMRKRKRKLVDPLQYEMSIVAEDLVNYAPAFGWESEPPTEEQKQALERRGILPDDIDSAGKASMLISRLKKRQAEGLTTPKQIRFLEGRGFRQVGTWSFECARKMIDRIAANGWRVPWDIVPAEYAGE